MTGRPRLVTSRSRQRELLGEWSIWALTSIFIEPSDVARVRESGWSGTHHVDPRTGDRIGVTIGGLGFGLDGGWRNPREVIAWSDVEAIAASVPREIREQLLALGERQREQHKTFPRFAASAAAVGCGPIVEGQPLTARQQAYIRELQEFEASGVLQAWEERHALLDIERLRLHERALADGLDDDPVDLLDLLEEQSPEPSAERTALGRRPALEPPTMRPPEEAAPDPASPAAGVAR